MWPGRGVCLVSPGLAERPCLQIYYSEPHGMWVSCTEHHDNHAGRSLGEQRGLVTEKATMVGPHRFLPHTH